MVMVNPSMDVPLWYVLALPYLDYLLGDVLRFENPRLIKTDIARAFRNIRVDLGDAMKL